MRLLPLLSLSLVLASFSQAQPAAAVRLFSLDLSSSARADDVLSAGPIGGPPNVEPEFTEALKFPAAPGEEMDALTTCGPVTNALEFSVDRLSVGAPLTQLAGEAAAGQAAADVFVADLSEGVHWFGRPQHLLGVLPPIRPGVLYSPPPAIDNLDALDTVQSEVMGCLLFSVPSSNGLIGASGADILFEAGPPPAAVSVAFGYALMGLSASDDIDALHIDLPNDIYFSLAPGSPTLDGANAICSDPCSAADVFHSSASATASRVYTADQLGLAESDNLDAMGFVDAIPVPSLSRGGLALSALLLAAVAALGVPGFGPTGLRRESTAPGCDGRG